MGGFLSWVDRRHFVSVRALTMYVTLWMTWEVTAWAFRFASATMLPGMEVAAIIAAVTAPVCALQGFVFKFYMDAKG